MADNGDNGFTSFLPQPSIRAASPKKHLAEMSASQTNTRSAMLPPQKALKIQQRQTLVDRAGDFSNSKGSSVPTASKIGHASFKPTSLAGASRQNGFSSSMSSIRPPSSASSRNTSNGSFASSAGPGSSYAQNNRPQSALQNPKYQKQNTNFHRPSTSLETHAGPQGITRPAKRKAPFEPEDDFGEFKTQLSEMMNKINGANQESDRAKALVESYKSRVSEVETMLEKMTSTNSALRSDIDDLKAQHARCTFDMQDIRRAADIRFDDAERQFRRDLVDLKAEKEEDLRILSRKHYDEMTNVRRQLEDAVEDEKARRRKEIESLTSEGAVSQQKAEVELDKREQELRGVQKEVEKEKANTAREQDLNKELRAQVTTATSNNITLESANQTLRAHITFLESDSKSQSQAFADLEMRMQNAIKGEAEAMEKLRAEESLRRKLHNQVQELKGNIRVFCRVRPSIETEEEAAKISFPDSEEDSKEVEVLGQPEKSSLGKITTKTHPFSFDRVFSPKSTNADIFDEINQLVQSALDGYNVCIFCYGQTGSGKTYTMSSEDGMIPRATRQIYDTAKSLEEKGWTYSMEGSFVEVYNENINDLLGKAGDLDKKKHEIQHDLQACKTTITGVNTVDLDSPNKVEVILERAAANRSVAATQANERSSRSHSVFILKLIGQNSITGERSEGTLNLVDLAGSERLSHSQATGERLKETQSINKSLSCLGDVIGALGQGKEGGHVPYRNSKLTYLLQFSLGGNSKTLMFVMISPLQAHLNETLTSLKFATKVHNTHIGTAKKQSKVH